nr:unnamed protein product [Callosobruchus chinensis]
MWYLFNSVVLVTSCLLVLLHSVDGQDKNQNGKIIYPNDELTDDRNHQHHYHGGFPPGFQHSPEFHQTNRVFPPGFQHSPEYHRNDGKCCKQPTATQQTGINGIRASTERSTNQHTNVPLDLALKISEVENVTELFTNYVEDDDDIDTPVLTSRFGDEPRSKYQGGEDSAIIPKPAGCQPEKVSVKLGTDTDPTILYMPPCTRIERCGGCCSHPLLECQPTDTKIIPFQIKKTRYTGSNKLKVISKEVVLIEKHVACKCGCIIKAKDCNKYQEYHEAECRCACVNMDEASKCTNNHQKLWNPKICACQCREVLECTTGYIFDQQECKCLPDILKRRIVPEQVADASYYDKYY